MDSIIPRRDPPRLAQVLGYWQALRGPDGSLPKRADFDPRGIADALEGTMLLERIAPGQVRIRLAGMQLCDLMGMDPRGMPLSALVSVASRAMLADRLEAVMDNPAIARCSLSGETGFLRPAFRAEMIVLPMVGRSGRTDRALATLAFDGEAPRRNAGRLVLGRVALSPIDGLRYAAPSGNGVASLAEAAEAAAPFTPRPAPGRPHLRLVKG